MVELTGSGQDDIFKSNETEARMELNDSLDLV
jgi:hypothetical protein